MNRILGSLLLVCRCFVVFASPAEAEYIDGMSQYRAYFVPRGVDPSGEVFELVRETLPIREIIRYTGASRAYTGNNSRRPGIAKPILSGRDDVRETEGGCCAYVKSAKTIELRVLNLNPSDAVASGAYTERGWRDAQEHENKRIAAYATAHNHYLSPIDSHGVVSTACGTICDRDNPGNAKTLLENYLKLNRSLAISNFNSWIDKEQFNIGKYDKFKYIKPPVGSWARRTRRWQNDGFKGQYNLSNPPDMKWATCPQPE